MKVSKQLQKKKIKSDRNLSIEFLRFLFALLVVMVHTHGLRPDNPKSYPFAGGTTAVEFFLILSGYFVMQSMIETNVEPQDCGKISLQFTWKRFRSIFFYVLCSVILQYSVEAIVQKESFYTIAKTFCILFLRSHFSL